MQSAPEHPQEDQRIKALLRYEVLDTDDEKAFDELTQLASEICGTPISLISLVDVDRQWFKSKVGLDAPETERSIAFCSHAILQEGVFEIPNATEDPRFHDNPLVTGAPDIRFYAGMPLVTSDGYPLGTLCVIDQEPHVLSDFQKRSLEILSRQVISQLETRLHAKQLERINKDRQTFYASLAHDLKSPFNGILNLSKMLSQHASSLEPEQIVEMASQILDSSISVYQVMDEILQWTDSQLNKGKLDLEPVPVFEVAKHATDLVKESAESKQIGIRTEINQHLKAKADPTLLRSIFRNLVTNAVKYSPANSEICIAAERRNNNILMSVSDQGEGIKPDLKAKLFLDKVCSQSGTMGELGNGLGLCLSSEFAKRQNGRMWVDRDYTEGTKIVLQLKAP